MMMTSATNTMALGNTSKKKPRKPYTISRPREKWTAEEHDRFLHSLLMFGRDWKTIEQFVATKTATQIRSHAQKYFLKAQRLGIAATLPPLHPRRAAVLLPHQQPPITTSCFLDDAAPATASCSASVAGAAACWPNHDDSFMVTQNSSGSSPSEEEAWFADSLLRDDTVIQLPLSPDDLRFAEVYRFVGDIFGSGTQQPVDERLQRLNGVDPVVMEAVLLVLKNLQDNLCA